MLGLRKKDTSSPTRAPCVASTAVGTEGRRIKWPDRQHKEMSSRWKERKDQERLKIYQRKSLPERGRCFSMGQATLCGPVILDEKRFVAATRNSAGEKGEQKEQ